MIKRVTVILKTNKQTKKRACSGCVQLTKPHQFYFPFFSLQASWILVEQGPVSALLQWARRAGLLLRGAEKLYLPRGASHLSGSHTLQHWHLLHLLLLVRRRQRDPLRSLSPRQHSTSRLLSTKHRRVFGPLPELWLGHAWCWGTFFFFRTFLMPLDPVVVKWC